MEVYKKGDNNNRASKKKLLETWKVRIEAPMDRGISNFKNSMIMKAIMETKNRVVVYIIPFIFLYVS